MDGLLYSLSLLDWHAALGWLAWAIVGIVLSVVAITAVLVGLPSDYFHALSQKSILPGKPLFVRWVVLAAKNLLGLVLILIGIMLSLPGIPGQGLLTIMIGVLLLDIPGKHPLQSKWMNTPSIINLINKIRQHFGRPPLTRD